MTRLEFSFLISAHDTPDMAKWLSISMRSCRFLSNLSAIVNSRFVSTIYQYIWSMSACACGDKSSDGMKLLDKSLCLGFFLQAFFPGCQ